MIIKRWFPTFAPATVITIAAVFAVSLAAVSVMSALKGPWLGVVFDRSYAGTGVRIQNVAENSPAAGKLNAGDIIQAVEKSLVRVEVSSLSIMEDPHYLPSYAAYNSFVEHQQKLLETISSRSFSAVLADGRKIELAAAGFPGPSALPLAFWWLIFFGGASFLLGASVWSFRRSDPIVRVLAISGMGFMVGAYCCVIYVTRELTLSSRDYFILVSASHLGFVIFAYSAVLSFWYYPRKLGNGPVAWLFVALGGAIWLNETLQWRTWPAHPFYAHFVVAYILLVLFTWLQWRKSRSSPLERAMLKWMLATMSVTLGLNIVLFCLPIIMSGKPIASTELTFGSIFVFYLGLIIGIIRYRKFDVKGWWIKAWQWLLFILLALAADAVFVYFLNLNKAASGGLSIAVGTAYLLARQWFWGRFSGNRSRALDRALPHLVDVLILPQYRTKPEQQWQLLIEHVYNPLTVKIIPNKCANVSVEQNGLALRLPSLDSASTIEAYCCDRGERLFTRADLNLANQLLDLMHHSQDVINAREQGVQEERHRIQRDLHDDVAARLLSLLHQTREPAISRVASNALRGLRDVIHLLGAEEATLEDAMSDIEAGAREQLAGLGVHFEWHAPEIWPDMLLNPQQFINLRRIAREAIANALKHAKPANIIIEASLEMKELCLRISNNGTSTTPSAWIPGRGLNNIKSRVAEMHGSCKWELEQEDASRQYCSVFLRMPLSLG